MGYAAVDDQEVRELVARANAFRRGIDSGEEARRAEALCIGLFRCDERIAAYGLLAPGEPRHYLLAGFKGAWTPGVVRGRMEKDVFAPLGQRRIMLDAGAEPVPVSVLHAPMLKDAWAASLLFSIGVARLLTPVENADGVVAVANIFALPPQD